MDYKEFKSSIENVFKEHNVSEEYAIPLMEHIISMQLTIGESFGGKFGDNPGRAMLGIYRIIVKSLEEKWGGS